MKKVLSLFAILLMASIFCACGQAEETVSVDTTGISQSEYKKLSIGMSYLEVGNIIGGSGEKIGVEKNDDSTTYTYKFNGERTGYAELVFVTDDLSLMELRSMKEYDLS